ncbi:MAG: S46 family peptidase [Rheinheimera sp.]|nr:S46 family peptidase [Rheinheimera sp.]
MKSAKHLSGWYEQTDLLKGGDRAWLGWIKRPNNSAKVLIHFIKTAVALYDTHMQREQAAKIPEWRIVKRRPAYMQAIIAYNKPKADRKSYPDANSTLRITIGSVDGYMAARRCL